MQQPFQNKLIAGDSWRWSQRAEQFPAADGWVLTYYFRGQGCKLDIAGIADDSGAFVLSASSEDTAKLAGGTYSWQAVVVKGADRLELARGTIEIFADIASQDGDFDGRSWVKRTLDAIRAVLQGTADRAEQEYTVGAGGAQRTLRLCSRKELLELECEFAARYKSELIEAGQLPPRSGDIRFSFGGCASRDGVWK